MQLAILGAGGTSLLMREVARRTGEFQDVAFLDDDPVKQRHGVRGVPVLGGLTSWVDLGPHVLFLSSLYGAPEPARLPGVVKALGIPENRWAIVVDPTAVICSGTILAPGVFVGPHVTLEPDVRVGKCSIVAENCIIGHDSTLASYVFCGSASALGSRIVVEDEAFLGVGSRVMNGVRVGRAATIGMGGVLVREVAAEDTVVGNPARSLPRVDPVAQGGAVK